MSKINGQINRHNKNMQKLSRRYIYSLDQFLFGSTGNLLITGGLKENRRKTLLKQINYYRQKTNSSIIIFSDDKLLENELINLAENDIIGQLYIFSSKYNNYNFFGNMPINLISEYFAKAALFRGYKDTSNLLTFTDAFLQILSEDDEVDFASIKKYICYDNVDIQNATNRSDLKNMIIGSADGGNSLRGVVTATSWAFDLLTNKTSDLFSISSEIDNDCVILINIPKHNYDLFAIYFAMELKAIINSSFNLIIDDEIMLKNDELFNAVKLMKQRNNVDVILSYNNIMSIKKMDEDILVNIDRQIIFLNGEMPAIDLQSLLEEHGQYNAAEKFKGEGAPPAYIYTFLRTKNVFPAIYQRDRLLLQELDHYEAILSKGSNAEIIAVKKFYL